MNLSVLSDELTSDPLTRGYSGMTDEAAAADLNISYRSRNRTSMTGSEVLNAVDTTEWVGLTDAQRQTVWDVVHLGDINPFGVEQTLMINVFGGGSDTITALASARITLVSRAIELGLGSVRAGDVQRARA